MNNPVRTRRLGRLLFCLIIALLPAVAAEASGPATTMVADTVFRADGSAASGTLVIAWPAFTTADGKAIPAGRKTVKIGAAGAVSIPLVPNFGASPGGTYYKVTYKLDDGSSSDEYWSVPAAPTTTISAIRSQLVPANVAVQYATRQYVDSMLAQGGSGNAIKIQGKDVDVAEPAPGQSLAFDGTKYVPQSHATVDVLRDCGAKGDGVTDDRPTLQACINSHPGATIVFPRTATGACYYLGTATATYTPAGGVPENFALITNGGGMRLTGIGSGFGSGSACLKLAANLTAILIPNSAATYGLGYTGGWAEVDHLYIDGQQYWDNTNVNQCVIPNPQGTNDDYGASPSNITADGIRVAATSSRIHDNFVTGMGRHGIMLDGDSVGKGAFSDFSTLERNWAGNNRGSGIYNRGGSDSNGISFDSNVAYANQLDGFYENSFIVASHRGDRTHSNHLSSPDTCGAIWAAAGNDVADARGIRAKNGAGQVTWVDTYYEGDQPLASMTGFNRIIGGGILVDWSTSSRPTLTKTSDAAGAQLFGESWYGGIDSSGNNSDMQFIAGDRSTTPSYLYAILNNNPFAAPAGSKGALYFGLSSTSASGRWAWYCCTGTLNASFNNSPLWMEYGATTEAGALNAKVGFPNGFIHGYTGANTAELWFGNSNAVANLPTWFTQNRGSVALNNQAEAGGFAGWIATSSGAPGAYKAFGPIANDAAGTSWSFPQISVGGSNAISGASGNSGTLAQSSGPMTAARCVHTDAAGNLTVAAADCPAGATPTPLATGTTVTLTGPRQYYVCTGACTVTPPVPAAGYEFCVMNDDNVSGVITFAALGGSAQYENQARTAYGTPGTGALTSGGALKDQACLVGRDSTHYLLVNSTGTWTVN